MPGSLQKTVFTEQLLPKVKDFNCGNDQWELEVSNWIKAPVGSSPVPGALDEMANTDRPCEVWLYGTEQGELVGLGSLGLSKWRWPRPNKSPQVPISVIPYIGIRVEFRGTPERFGSQILADLKAEALTHPDREPVLGLFVDVRNQAALKFYGKEGFQAFGKPILDNATQSQRQRMILDLRSPGA
jgi:ribosomal protein S18 acetylase RimI-like enzyme